MGEIITPAHVERDSHGNVRFTPELVSLFLPLISRAERRHARCEAAGYHRESRCYGEAVHQLRRLARWDSGASVFKSAAYIPADTWPLVLDSIQPGAAVDFACQCPVHSGQETAANFF